MFVIDCECLKAVSRTPDFFVGVWPHMYRRDIFRYARQWVILPAIACGHTVLSLSDFLIPSLLMSSPMVSTLVCKIFCRQLTKR